MSLELWTAVDAYIVSQLAPSDPALDAALAASDAAGLPAISVTPNLGKLLMLFAKLVSAKRILEVGTLGGYSTIWLARALPPGGRMITLEFEPAHAKVAAANIVAAGLAQSVEIRVGDALESLPKIAAEHPEPFDLIFIDADKKSNPEYFNWALRLARKGSLIIVDNVVRDGKVIEPDTGDPNIDGVRRLNELVGQEPRVSATAIQTVGSKGYDGFLVAIVES